jgi:glucose/arabinose dehydrogenase
MRRQAGANTTSAGPERGVGSIRPRTRALPLVALALVGAAALIVAGCDDDLPTEPSPVAPSPVTGAITVRGTERLAWSQDGDLSSLRFRAYVDGRSVALEGVSCSRATPGSACTAPLPPLTVGVHTIALTSISVPTGVESLQVERVTLQKVAASATVSAASLPDAVVRPGSLRLESMVATTDGLTFAVDVVARGLVAPVQLAWLPDARLLVAEANGRVRVVRPGEPEGVEPALDAQALLQPAPIGALGVTAHPDFLRNRFVYVSFLARERADRTLLRIVRLREVGDTLGEPATLFEAPVTIEEAAADDPRNERARGPNLAFGPDGLLYLALPPGAEFVNEPAASRPRASMLRLSDDGRVPSVGPLTGVTAHLLGFTWHPSTGALWAAFSGENGEAELRPITAGRTSSVAETGYSGLRVAPGVVMLQGGATSARALARAVIAAPASESTGAIRLAVPILAESRPAGLLDRIGDIVMGAGGTLFVATDNAEYVAGQVAATADVIVRLTPRATKVEVVP